MSRKVEIEIRVKTKGAGQSVRGLDKDVDRLGKTSTTATRAAEKGFKRLGGVAQVALGNLAATAVTNLANSLVRLGRSGFRQLSDSVKLAGIQDIANRKLEQAIRNTGAATEEWLPKLQAAATEVQRLSNFGDEEVQTAQAMLLSFQEVAGPQGAQLLTKRLADTAAGVAKVSGQTMDLNSVAALMGRALTQGASSLTRVGVSLDDTQKAAFDAAEGLDRVQILAGILDSNFRGLAEVTADPFKQLTMAAGDSKEALGSGLLPVLRDYARQMTAFLQRQDVNDFLKRLGEGIGEFVDSVIDFPAQIELLIMKTRSELNRFDADAARTAHRFRFLWGGVIGGIKSNLAELADNLEARAQAADDRAAEIEKELATKRKNREKRRTQERLAMELQSIQDEATARDEAAEKAAREAQQRELVLQNARVAVMKDGTAKALAQIDLQIDEEIRKAKELYAKDYPEVFTELESLLEEQREQLRAKLLAKPPLEIAGDPNALIHPLETALLDLGDPLQVLDGSLNGVNGELERLQSLFNAATTDQARREIAAMIATLEETRGKLEEVKNTGRVTFEDIASAVREAAQVLGGVFNAQHVSRMNEIEAERSAALDSIDRQLESEKLSQKQKTDLLQKRAKLEKGFEDQRKEAAKKQAERAKIVSLFEIAINTAAAVVKALPNVVLAAIVGGLGLAQAGVVAATPVPSFRKGVRNFEGGLAQVHKDEIVYLPPQSSVVSQNESRRVLDAVSRMSRPGSSSFDDRRMVQAIDRQGRALESMARKMNRLEVNLNLREFGEQFAEFQHTEARILGTAGGSSYERQRTLPDGTKDRTWVK